MRKNSIISMEKWGCSKRVNSGGRLDCCMSNWLIKEITRMLLAKTGTLYKLLFRTICLGDQLNFL